MVTVTATGIFARTYLFKSGPEIVARLPMSRKPNLLIEGKTFQMTRGFFSSAARLEHQGSTVATITRIPGILSRAWQIHFDHRTLTLKPAGMFTRNMTLLENNHQLGILEARGSLNFQCTLNFPQDIPFPVQIFIFWYAATIWAQAAAAAAG